MGDRLARLTTLFGWRLVLLVAAVVVLAAGAAAGFAGSARRPPVPQSAGSPDVAELAARLLAAPALGGQPLAAQLPGVQLLPGQVASDLPVSLTLPPEARVVGSVARGSGNVTFVLDVPGERSGVQAFFQKELAAKGWNPPASFQARGFQTNVPGVPTNFCSPQANALLLINIYSGQGGVNDVRITSLTTSPNLCRQPLPAPSASNPIPPLYPPEGVTIQPSGVGGTTGRFWNSDAIATSDQQSGSLEQHFAGQLQSAKWVRLDGRDDGMLAWSAWKVPEGDWQGLLYVANAPGQNRRLLHVDAQSATAQQAGGPTSAFAQAVAVAQPLPAVAPPAAVTAVAVATGPAPSASPKPSAS